MHVFYYWIPYSNEKYHQNRLVLARKTVLFYFSGILVGISMPNPRRCMKTVTIRSMSTGGYEVINITLNLAPLRTKSELSPSLRRVGGRVDT